MVQYGSEWGYIRADLMRMLDPWEEEQYLNSLKTPAPTLVTTPQPYDENNLSSYGYVSSSTVNFRQSASTSSTRLATLRQYAFCLVLGTTQSNGTTWYKVNYGGKVGYIQGDYFKQLTIAELQDFLLSNEYKQGIANNSSSSSGSSGSTSGGTSNLPSAEDQTVQEWTNPNSGINVSYEPFDPFATPEPLVTASPPASASPSAEATTLEPLETLPWNIPPRIRKAAKVAQRLAGCWPQRWCCWVAAVADMPMCCISRTNAGPRSGQPNAGQQPNARVKAQIAPMPVLAQLRSRAPVPIMLAEPQRPRNGPPQPQQPGRQRPELTAQPNRRVAPMLAKAVRRAAAEQARMLISSGPPP